MKKAFAVIIALVVVGTIVVPVVQAQSEADIKAMEQLTKDFQAGKITMPEFQRRMEELVNRAAQQGYQEDSQRNQQQRQNAPAAPQVPGAVRGIQRPSYPGATAGWPTASAFRRYGVTISQPNIKTPHGLVFSYKITGETLIIYITKAQDVDNMQELAMHGYWTDEERNGIEQHFLRAFGGKTEIPDPTRRNTATMQYFISLSSQEEGEEINLMSSLGYAVFKFISIEITPRSSQIFDKG